MRYLISFLLLAIVAVQAYPSDYSKDQILPEEFAFENSQARIDFWDIIKKAKETIEKITKDLKDLFYRITNQIQNIISVGSVNQIKNDITEEIKTKLANAGITGNLQTCLDYQGVNIQKAAKTFKTDSNNCVDGAQSKLEDIEKKARQIKSEATNLLYEAAKNGTDCLLHPTTAPSCLKGVLNNLQTGGNNLMDKINVILSIGSSLLNELETCQKKAEDDLQSSKDKIYNDIVECAQKPEPRSLDKELKGWTEVWEKIKELLKNGKEMIEKITKNLNEIFQEIQQTIKDIIGVGSIDDIIKKITDYLEKLLGTTEKVKQCIAKQKDVITKIAEDVKNGATQCVSGAQGKLEDIEKQALAIKDASSKLLSEGVTNATKCLTDPLNILTCLTNVLNGLKTGGNKLQGQIENVVDTAKDMLSSLRKCQDSVTSDAQTRIKAVYDDVTTCVNTKDLSADAAWDEIWTKIKQFIEEAKKVIDKFTKDLEELFQKIKEKIEEISSIENVDDLVKIIINDLVDMAAEAGIQIKPECLTSQMEPIKKIAQENRDAALKCASDAKGKVKQIKEDAQKVQTDAKNLLKEAFNNGTSCIFKPSTALTCLKDVSDNLTSKSKVLLTQVEAVMTSAQNMLDDLNQCQQNIKDNFFGAIDKVFEEIKECNEAGKLPVISFKKYN